MTETFCLPTDVGVCLNDAGLNHRPVWLAVDTDITLDGARQSQWLVATRDHLSLVAQTGDEKPTNGGSSTSPVMAAGPQPSGSSLLGYWPWDAILAVRTLAGVGSGRLQLQTTDGWIDVLRFSNSLAHRFHKVSRHLDLYRDKSTEDAEQPEPHSTMNAVTFESPRCPSCKLRLSDKEESCPRCLQRGQILQRLWGLLRPHWRGGLLLSGLTILGVVAELIPPKLQQYLVDNVMAGQVGDQIHVHTALLAVVLALALSRILLSVVAVIKGRLASWIGSSVTCSLRLQMVRKLQDMAVAYYDRHQVGSMISRVAHDSEVLSGLMHQLTGGFLLQIVQLVGVGAMLLWLNVKLALFTLIPVPLVFLGSWYFWQKVYPRYYRLWDASSKQMAVLSGMLSGIRVVKAFAQQDREYQRFQTAAEHLRDWRLWVEHASARYSATMQIVFSLGGLIVWYVGGRDVLGQQMTLGQLIAFLAYLSMFYAPLGALSNFTTWLTSFLSGSKRILELLDTPIDILEPANPVDWPEAKGTIEFDHVTFGYDRNQPVLKDISFQVAPGEMIGIVGRSGSGKTTMVNLLGRFYDVQEGSIRIDGTDLRDLSTSQLRDRLGIVFQDSFLFRGTIWNNLSYGRPQSSIEEGLAAAKAAGAHDFICRTQLAYETQLGEHGSGLSGGERQRLSIARTLLYDPRILVLDEATSNIDAESEKSIQEALTELIRGRTTIAIAHRLSTLRNADRILVFDRGRLVEQGTHAQLLVADGVYARLVRIQTQVSKDPNVDRLMQQAAENSHHDQASESGTVASEEVSEETKSGQSNSVGANRLRWLDPALDRFVRDDYRQLGFVRHGEERQLGVFIVRAFPATHSSEYLSVRQWTEQGDDVELGMIRDLAQWPSWAQEWIQQSLDRHYLLPRIERIHAARLDLGFLNFDVDTDQGRRQFALRWTQSSALHFGENGKLLIDTDDNRFVVEDIDQLMPRDRERFLQYIYW